MSKFEIKETIGCTKKISVEIDKDRVDKDVETTVKELKKSVVLPGFRKGKAPESMIVKKYAGTIREEALKEMIPNVIEEMFKEKGLKPVGDPVISDMNLPEDGTVSFVVSIEEIPEIDPDGFNGLKVIKEVREVKPDDVDAEIERLRHRMAKQEEVDHEARKDNIIVANLQKIDASGVPLIGEKVQKMAFELNGKNTPSPDFDGQVIGMNKGDKKVVTITYENAPDSDEETAMTETYEIELLQVFDNTIPELNDDFAKAAGNYNNIEELKTAIKDGIQHRLDYLSEEKLHRDIIEEFLKENPFEVPNGMVEKVVKSNLEDAKKREQQEINEEEYRKAIRPDAVRAVQTFIIIDKIKEKNNLTASREEIDSRIDSLATVYNVKPSEYKRSLIKNGRLEEIGNDIIREKVYKWMTEIADIKEEKVTVKKSESKIIKP